MLAVRQRKSVWSLRSGRAIDNSPLNLKLGVRRSGIVVASDHDSDGMLRRPQPADMPIVVIACILGDPSVDFSGLLAVKENVSTAALLGAAAHNCNARAFKCEGRFRTGRPASLNFSSSPQGNLTDPSLKLPLNVQAASVSSTRFSGTPMSHCSRGGA